MYKTELIAAMAEKAGMTKVDAGKALNAYVDVVKKQLASAIVIEYIKKPKIKDTSLSDLSPLKLKS